MPIKQEITQNLTGHWSVGLFEAPCQAPHIFLYGCCCTCCAVYQQREELLTLTGEPYICCAGLFPCGPLGEPQDKTCLFAEVCCCTGLALGANRFMVQTRFDKENTACDDCILWTTCLFSCAVDIAQCFMDVPREIELLSDCANMTVNGCMHTQQHIEIQEIKKNGYQGPPAHVMGVLPPKQLEMIQQAHPGQYGGPAPQMMGGPPQQNMYGGQQPQGIQVRCGGCSNIFGSPQSGVTVACPHCGTHNQVPFQ
mmetsp:Transcript_14899/g.32174  ORF Transcript_14899/g.32174 Transcript_14899/m.32174 type:complete len:253 (-) Transcript_14899:71-829(-)